ncbi:sodium/calcium exchanger regulatory protein 1-like [Argonauta hians]
MSSEMAGKWILESSENFNDYMKAIGVGMATRTMANMATPVQDITVNGDQWTIKTSTTFKTTDIAFTIGKEFEETTADGRKVMTTVTIEGKTLVQDQKGSPNSTLKRELKDDGKMHMVLTVNDVVCTRIYKRVTE